VDDELDQARGSVASCRSATLADLETPDAGAALLVVDVSSLAIIYLVDATQDSRSEYA
jgi:hypothetical protein